MKDASSRPHPPFPRQQQSYPGLARLMTPVPDHGEKSYVGHGRLAGKKALVTGADSGIGRAVSIAFAREGADVALNYLPGEEDDARKVIALIEAEGRKAVCVPGNLMQEEFCMRLVSEAVAQLGGLDIIVNNAGRQIYREHLSEISSSQFEETFRINVFAPFWIVKAALPHLKPGASLIATASVNAREPSDGLIDYAASKGAITTLTLAMAKNLAAQGIRANVVAPGPFWTALQPSGGQSPERVEHFGEDSPFGRPGQPAEIASLYVLLASDEASYITGSFLPVTGGKIV